MAVDIDVPERFGIRQSVGDTVGPGGVNLGPCATCRSSWASPGTSER